VGGRRLIGKVFLIPLNPAARQGDKKKDVHIKLEKYWKERKEEETDLCTPPPHTQKAPCWAQWFSPQADPCLPTPPHLPAQSPQLVPLGLWQ
jgi:hypothetical protein